MVSKGGYMRVINLFQSTIDTITAKWQYFFLFLLFFFGFPPLLVKLIYFSKIIFDPVFFINEWYKFILNSINVLFGSLIIGKIIKNQEKSIFKKKNNELVSKKLKGVQKLLSEINSKCTEINQSKDSIFLEIQESLDEIKISSQSISNLLVTYKENYSEYFLQFYDSLDKNLLSEIFRFADCVPDKKNIKTFIKTTEKLIKTIDEYLLKLNYE